MCNLMCLYLCILYVCFVLHADNDNDNKHFTQLRARVRSNKIASHSIVRDYGKVYFSTVAVLVDKL